MKEIPDQVLDLLKSKFNIIEHLSFLEFDWNFEILKDKLSAVRKDQFDIRDKIVIEHLDTDFYYPESLVGINLKNFFTVANIVDIPLNLFVFYTNHFGIKREIDIICQNTDSNYRPMVLESFISKLHYPTSRYDSIESNIDLISYPALTLIRGHRSHRNALYNHLKDVDKNQLAINFYTA